MDQLSEHYNADRIPGVNIVDEGGASYATLIPAHFHHTLFEILKVCRRIWVQVNGLQRPPYSNQSSPFLFPLPPK